METNPPITWLMPVRNGMPYLPLTLASIQAQTYPHHRLLVWDNGSSDGTVEELKRWIPARLKGDVITGRPLSLGASLAALVEAARTEFCARVDADDISVPERLAKQIEFLRVDSQACAVGSQVDFIDSEGRLLDGAWVLPTDDAEIRWGTRWRPLSLHATFLFRRSKVLEAGNYRAHSPVEDHDLLIRLGMTGRLPNLPEKLYRWRRHSGSVTCQIPDHHEYHREAALMNIGILFPPLKRKQALRLWDVLYAYSEPGSARITDLRLLRYAARGLAKAVGENATYFEGTKLYCEQRWHLRQRCLNAMGLRPLVLLKRKLQSAASG